MLCGMTTLFMSSGRQPGMFQGYHRLGAKAPHASHLWSRAQSMPGGRPSGAPVTPCHSTGYKERLLPCLPSVDGRPDSSQRPLGYNMHRMEEWHRPSSHTLGSHCLLKPPTRGAGAALGTPAVRLGLKEP